MPGALRRSSMRLPLLQTLGVAKLETGAPSSRTGGVGATAEVATGAGAGSGCAGVGDDALAALACACSRVTPICRIGSAARRGPLPLSIQACLDTGSTRDRLAMSSGSPARQSRRANRGSSCRSTPAQSNWAMPDSNPAMPLPRLQAEFFDQIADPQGVRAIFEHMPGVFFFMKDDQGRRELTAVGREQTEKGGGA